VNPANGTFASNGARGRVIIFENGSWMALSQEGDGEFCSWGCLDT